MEEFHQVEDRVVASTKTIRAVERAFLVLHTLEDTPQGSTLVELEEATKLPGPTLLRLLATLENEQAVRRGLYDRRWRSTVRLRSLTRGVGAIERFAAIAATRLEELCSLVRWPSDVAVHLGNDDFMTVLESTLRRSPFYVRRVKPGRVNLLMSAVGTAYLAHLPAARCRALVRTARAGTDLHNHSAIAAGDLSKRLARARTLGYATRHRLFLGGKYNEPARDDRTYSIAVPILNEGAVYGAVNINWNRYSDSEEEMATRHLEHLHYVAKSIADEARDLGVFAEWP
jgi:IclR family mhp operon transcriptional activator